MTTPPQRRSKRPTLTPQRPRPRPSNHRTKPRALHNAETLGVEYLIWQGQIWSLARYEEGWHLYKGGMHDPNDVTGGHYAHAHITVKEGNRYP
ncbi:hypothetical protein BSZ40_07920 [Buchananella hordeovulneris]|uniref:ARB-07466-like C-terminal domain-containing protein n=1 Tax=Buchananella hordeovulneris TaxID=52770 RepID=A0A1Q5PVF9_9ACTO|nr:hypothetical protein BSZ40_07920 [Buchananella hordeovulneris]